MVAAPPAKAPASPYQPDLTNALADVHTRANRSDAVEPLFRLADLEDVTPRPVWERAMSMAAATVTHPLVRAQAELLLAEIQDERGDGAAAQKRREQLGTVTNYFVVGPFDNEGGKGMAEVYPPESETTWSAGRRYPGKAREVAWRPGARAMSRGVLVPGALLRPQNDGVVYAASGFVLAAGGDVAVRIGASGEVKAWVDDKLAVAAAGDHPFGYDQQVGAVRLRAGPHRLLIKLGSRKAEARLCVRLTRLDGRALAWQPADPPAARGVGAARASARPAELEIKLAGRALGEYLSHVRPREAESDAAARAVEPTCAQAGAECLVRLAELEPAPDDKRRALERAIERAAAAHDARLEARAAAALGDVYAAGHRDRSAEALWRRALVLDGSCFPAALRLGELEVDRGLGAAGESMVAAWAERLPEVRRVALSYAHLLDRRGKPLLAERALAQLGALLPGDVELSRERYSLVRGRSDGLGALALIETLVKAEPESISLAFERAELLEGVARARDAERALEEVCVQVPDEPRAWELLGRLRDRQGQRKTAADALTRAVELEPQNATLRELLTRLGPREAQEDLQRAFGRDAVALAAQPLDPARFAGDASVVLLDLKVTRVHANGLGQVFVERVVRILDERGAREEAEQAVRYTPDSQMVDIRAARVIGPGGEVREAGARDDETMSEPWYGIYYDVRAQLVRFDRLAPGDVIDFEYTISDTARENQLADYFGDLHYFQEETPRLESVYAVLAPKTRPLYFNQPALPGLVHSERDRGGEHYYEWRARAVPKIEIEPGMPGLSEASAYVHVSTFKSWNDVAVFYGRLVAPQLLVDGPMRAALARAITGAPSELEKVKAIYDLVVRSTRYVGLEFGIHGFQPYRTTQVFSRKFGDCKDKAALLVTLLREAGIPARMVLVRTRRGGDLAAYPASLAVFDHAIAYVPKYDLWLDGTAEFAGSTELPYADQGVLVLPLGDESGKATLVRTPIAQAERNRVTRKESIALAAQGGGTIGEDLRVEGQAAAEWREHFQAAAERRERYEKSWIGRQPGAQVTEVEMKTELEQPVAIRARVQAPRLGWQSGAGLRLRPTTREGELARSYARLSARKHDLVLAYPWQQDEQFVFRLPASWHIKRVPEPRHLQTPFGSFTFEVAPHGEEIDVVARLTVTRHRVTPSDYPAFRRFLLDVDAALDDEIEVSP
jgi:tetratricopeptide (TPR) repeat protein